MTNKTMIRFFLGSLALFFLITIVLSGFYTVQPGQISFEKTFGKIDNKINGQGLYFKLPFVTQAVKMNIKNIVVTTKATAASKDVQEVTSEIAVNFSIKKEAAIKLYSTVGTEEIITDRIVKKAIQEAIKAATASFTATESITKRTKVSDLIVSNLKNKLEPRGLAINQVDILNFDFSPSFNRAIEAKVTAQQDALKSKALVEKVKYEAEAKIAKAEGDAKAVEIAAIAEAQAIKIKAKAIQAQGGKDYIQLQWINQWNGVLPTTSLGTNTSAFINLK